MSEFFLIGNRKFVLEPQIRVRWDDEISDFDFKCRTQTLDLATPNPPAVMRYYKKPIDKQGDFRVNLAAPYDWKQAIISVNGGSVRKWEYLTGRARALYNDPDQGWPMQAYIVMCGNRLSGEFQGDWFVFETLKPSDLSRVRGMTINTHPHFVHNFTCVGWDNETKTTKRINSTGTQHGNVYYFVVSNEGIGFIPKRHVIAV